MKKLFLITLVLFNLIGIYGQVPVNSTTNGSDVWYYIGGMRGPSNTQTWATAKADNSKVLHEALNFSDSQLWKVVTNGSGLALQNKAFGTYMNVDAAYNGSVGTVATIPTAVLTIELSTATTKPTGSVTLYKSGAAGTFRLHAGGTPSGWFNYNNINDNCSFLFLEQSKAVYPQVSTEGNETWYFIKGQRGSSATGLYATQTTDNTGITNLQLTNSDYQLWKLVSNGSGYALQNKADGSFLNVDATTSPITTKATLPTNPLKLFISPFWTSSYLLTATGLNVHVGSTNANYKWINYNGGIDNCSLQFIDASTVLTEAIADAELLYASALVGNNPGQYTTENKAVYRAAIDNAITVNNNPASTSSEKSATATTLLTTTKTTFLATLNPIKYSTNESVTWYAIKTPGRTGANYLKDAGIGNTVLGSPFVSSSSILWKIVDTGSSTVNIISKLNAGQMINSTTQSADVKLSATDQARTITSLGAAQFNINGGTYQLHLAGGGNLVGYNGGLNSASAWMFEEITFASIINAAENTYSIYPAGTNPAQYKLANKEIFRAAIDAAIAVQQNTSATPTDISLAMDNLMAASDAFINSEVNQIKVSNSENDTWYYITSGYTDGYSFNKTMVDLVSATFKINWGNKDTNNNQYWRFVEGSTVGTYKIQNRATGKYISSPTAWAASLMSTTGDNFTVTLLGQGIVTLNAPSIQPLHAASSNSEVVCWTGGLNSASAWKLEEIVFTAQSITFPAIPTKKRGNADFNLGATTNASGLSLTYHSSDENIATVSSSGDVTITATADGYTDITVSQSGNAVYAPATAVTNRLTISGVTTGFNTNNEIISIGVINRMLVVKGTNEQLTVYHVTGSEVDATKALNAGIYIVKIADKTFKVNVR